MVVSLIIVSLLTLVCQKSNVSLKKLSGGGGLFDYSVTSGPGLSKVKCQVPSYTRLGQGQGQGA